MQSPDVQSTLAALDDQMSLVVAGFAGGAIQLTGTWTATVAFEASVDNITFVPLQATNASSGATGTSATGNGVWLVGCTGIRVIRLRVSAYTSGIVFAKLKAAQDSSGGAGSGGGGGGGAVTIADGADVAQGATTDAAKTTDTDGTAVGFLRGLVKFFYTVVRGQQVMADSVSVTMASDQPAIPVSATFTGGTVDQGAAGVDPWPVTGPLTDVELRATPVPVSLSSAPLPTGGATAANQATQITAEQAIEAVLGTTADAADLAGTTSTANAKLRGLIQILADVWDSVNNRLDVFITNTSIAVTQSGAWVLSAGSALIGKVGIDQTTPGTTNRVAANVDQLNGNAIALGAGAVSAGTQRTTLASDDPAVAVLGTTSGAKVITDASGTIQQYLRGLIYLFITSGQALVTATLAAGTSGGWTPYKAISAASTNSTNVKGSAGQIGYIHVINTNAAIRYLKLYNKATAPTVGTDTPVHTFGIPGNTAGAGFTLTIPPGIAFGSGIGFGLTTGPTDADTGAVAANEITVNFGYK